MMSYCILENHYSMKLTIPNTYKKQAIPLVIFVSLSLVIWFIGPFLAIAHHEPLTHPEKRLYIIAALFLLWLLKFIFFDATAPVKKNVSLVTQLPPETAKRLQTLQGRFQGALNFLKKTIVTKQDLKINLSHLPWYLFMGPTDAGKTTLLANSKVNFILSKQFKQAEAVIIPTSDACDWWVTRDLVLIDVPGHYFANKEKNKSANILWNTLLNLVKTMPIKENMAGVIVGLNLPEIMKKTGSHEKNILIHDLKKRMTELRNHFGPQLSFHFVLTKCDLLPGFIEFFSETSTEELSQVWGLTMPALGPNDKWLDIFIFRFNALIKRINKQLLWRLHQERNPNTRPAIKDFPLHLERLKESLTALFKALAMPDLQLQGVYLTSATQMPAENPFSYTHASSPSHLTHQALQIMRAPVMPTRAYFVKQLVAQSFLYSQKDPTEKQVDYHWRRRSMYAASIGTIVTATLLLVHDFQQSMGKTYALQNALTHYQTYLQQSNPDDDRLIKALPLLDALQEAAIANHSLTRLQNILAFYSNKSQQTASAVYGRALQTIIIPEVKNDLEKYLRNANSKNPVPVYTALKAYLMMNDPDNLSSSFIANTINTINATPMNKQALAQLTSHIATVFSMHATNIELDQTLINDVRKQLVNLPTAELGFVILKSMGTNNDDSTLDLGTNLGSPPIFVSKQISNRIPNMYVATNFQKIMSDEISVASTEALKGNWVLGDISPTVNQPTADGLISELRNEYTSNYVDIWESQVANIQPFKPTSLLQTDEMIQNLTNNNSPLLQLLQTIKDNTAFDPVASSSPKMTALDNLVSSGDIKLSPLYEVFVDLRELHLYLQKILNSSNSNKNAFAAATGRMENSAEDPITTIRQLAEKQPEPLKSWLNTMADQSWSFILEKAGEHIASAWQSNVLPDYNQNIAKRYPFVQNSDQDIPLQQFTNFLGHHGTLANFYMSYLKPFVNDSGEQWVWRSVDNKRIPFSSGLLANLQQAAQLQRVFFPNGDNTLSIEFTMQPIALDPTMRTLTLNINGQQSAFQKNGKRLPQTFTWPGNYYSHGTTVSFITPQSKMISNTLKGDWGLFRLVSRSTESMNDKKGLVLNIAANGHSAKYMLYTSATINPFLPTSLGHFELPQDILRS